MNKDTTGQSGPTKYGFINNLLSTGNLGKVNVGIETKSIVKLAAGLAFVGGFIVLMVVLTKKLAR